RVTAYRPRRRAGSPPPGRRKRASRRPPGTPAPVSSPRPATPLSHARRAPPSDSRQGDRPEVVVFAGREPGTQEAPGFGPAAPLHVCDAVHVVRVLGRARALLGGV